MTVNPPKRKVKSAHGIPGWKVSDYPRALTKPAGAHIENLIFKSFRFYLTRGQISGILKMPRKEVGKNGNERTQTKS